MDKKREEGHACKDAAVSPGLIRPWPNEKFWYYPKFNLANRSRMDDGPGTADSVTNVDKDTDMTSLLDYGFELDLLESIDMSDFDCDNYKTRKESGNDRGLDIENAVSIHDQQKNKTKVT